MQRRLLLPRIDAISPRAHRVCESATACAVVAAATAALRSPVAGRQRLGLLRRRHVRPTLLQSRRDQSRERLAPHGRMDFSDRRERCGFRARQQNVLSKPRRCWHSVSSISRPRRTSSSRSTRRPACRRGASTRISTASALRRSELPRRESLGRSGHEAPGRLRAPGIHRHIGCPPARSRCRTGTPARISAPTARSISRPGCASATRPTISSLRRPPIYGNVVVVGSAIGDNRASTWSEASSAPSTHAAARCSGRSIPCRTRRRIPPPRNGICAQAATTGAGNSWGVMSIDEDNGLVLVPTGSASPDFFGGSGSAATASPTRSWRWMPRAASSPGSSNWFITTCGITISPRSRCWATSKSRAFPCRRSSRRPRPACSTCSIGPRASRCFRSPRSPCRPASSRASRPRQHNLFPPCLAGVTEAGSIPTTPGELRSGTAASAAT